MNSDLGVLFESAYARFNRREYIHPDPLEFLYLYDAPEDREVAGMIASALAFGHVNQILRAVKAVLEPMGSPRRFLIRASRARLGNVFQGFRHRYVNEGDLCDLLWGIRGVLKEHGSLGECLRTALKPDDETVLPALTVWVEQLKKASNGRRNYLLPDPRDGSACKRLHLFLRWMARRDAVDPGGWDFVGASRLIVPLDVHMGRIARFLGLTTRAQADGRAALEVTRAFRRWTPRDPVRYDFALTRMGIRADGELGAFMGACRQALGPAGGCTNIAESAV